MASLTRMAWRRNLSWIPPQSETRLFGMVDPDPSALAPEATPLDLVVLMTTFERPEPAQSTLRCLASALEEAGRNQVVRRSRVVVLDDASSSTTVDALRDGLARILPSNSVLLVAKTNQSKKAYWRNHALLHRIALRLPARHTLFLQDDLEFDASMISESIRIWSEISDPMKRVLYLLRLPDDEVDGRWVRFRREAGPTTDVDRTQWFDLQAFLVDPSFFRSLHHRVYPVPVSRWRRRPLLSSGVGEQLTLRLQGLGNIYQVRDSLVRTGRTQSLMNPESRARRPFRNVTPKD
jgi:hypothetical protein